MGMCLPLALQITKFRNMEGPVRMNNQSLIPGNDMKVVKIGGGCLKNADTIGHIMELVSDRGAGNVFVVSALYGVTDLLINGMFLALDNEDSISSQVNLIKDMHIDTASRMISGGGHFKSYEEQLGESLKQLERYYYGLSFTGELTDKMQDAISCIGEKLSAELLVNIQRSLDNKSEFILPEDMGLLTDGKYGDATVDLNTTSANLKKHLIPYLEKGFILFVPGFYGLSPKGDLTTFGRGGSDYSAAVVAASLEAEVLEIWKDVDGFMSADPSFVDDAEFIPSLSYEECAELSYFGATILHPRTVEPVRQRNIDIVIKNTMNPDAKGSVINASSNQHQNIIKSITYTKDIGILNVYASGVGARPGILGIVANQISDAGLNIKSVVTSQTCISLLLARKDLDAGFKALGKIKPVPFRKIEKINDIVLLAIVGEGLSTNKGIAAKCFTAISDKGGNVEMISFGPSRVALYFLLKENDLQLGIHAIHSTFFNGNE